jgi:hypothetical protein
MCLPPGGLWRSTAFIVVYGTIKQREDPVTLTLSENDYRRLLLLTRLGEWMVNAVRKEADPAFEDAASAVYAAAKGTPAEAFVGFDAGSGTWIPSEALEKDAQALIDQYDEVTFWEELTARMTERDLMASHGERTGRGLRPEARERAAKPIAKAYTREFETYGIDRLGVDDAGPV